jgi:hypothetical protein
VHPMPVNAEIMPLQYLCIVNSPRVTGFGFQNFQRLECSRQGRYPQINEPTLPVRPVRPRIPGPLCNFLFFTGITGVIIC